MEKPRSSVGDLVLDDEGLGDGVRCRAPFLRLIVWPVSARASCHPRSVTTVAAALEVSSTPQGGG